MSKKTTLLTSVQCAQLVPNTKKVFIEALDYFRKEDIHCYRDDFGTMSPEEVWNTTQFWVSDKGHLRAYQPNDIVMMWNSEHEEWDDEFHDE